MIGVVENAILARLKAASDEGIIPYAYRTLQTWPKNFDEYLSSQVIQYPACWAVFGGAHKTERLASGLWRVHCVFGVVVAAENLRNEQARRHGGSASEPGSYQLAVDALQILASQTLGLDIRALEPSSILPVETADIPKVKQLSIYAVSFDTAIDFATPPGKELGDFNRLHINWDPAPYGHVDRDQPLPQDAAAIASDSIQINGEDA